MHEALFDDHWLKDTGVTTLDFAKAMIDEGYHPMTVYFPLVVHGAMLIEPTELESKASLDLFIMTLRDLAMSALAGERERFVAAPVAAPRRRLDETRAARQPVLRWMKPAPACGAGAYRHHVPASVDHLIQRSEFLTSYTPYQPEIAQGTLQVLFEFQTQVAALTGMEVANASMYDGSTACGEAMLMAHRLTRRAQGGAVGRPASAICRRRRDARRDGGRRDRAPAARSAGRGGHRGADRRRDELRHRPERPISSAICAI